MDWVRGAAIAAAVVMSGVAGIGPAGAVADAQAAAATSQDVVVNEFMSYDPSARRVKLKLYAADGSNNGGMNFNGGSKGDQTITIPLGWSVHVDFQNKDAIPHSAIVLPDAMPLPATPGQPAIARAYTRELTGGIPTDGTDTMDFTAAPAASYLIVCGVPGHGPSGMYIKLVVSATAKVPAYTK